MAGLFENRTTCHAWATLPSLKLIVQLLLPELMKCSGQHALLNMITLTFKYAGSALQNDIACMAAAFTKFLNFGGTFLCCNVENNH
jgi:hypothetical protein